MGNVKMVVVDTGFVGELKAGMNRAGIAENIHAATGLPVRKCRQAIDAMLRVLSRALADNEAVTIRKFGRLSVVKKPARPGMNFQTGKAVAIRARRRVRMQISRAWKGEMQ